MIADCPGMATKEFILQGFTVRTHATAVRDLFAVAEIARVIISVAFVSESGVQELEAQLKANAKTAKVFAGIRNDITSHQGLARILGTGSKLFTVDTGSRNVLFHPKLYLVRGKARAQLVIGSANLTLGGLNNNIEAGMKIDFDLTNDADRAVVEEIEAKFDALPAEYPAHVVGVAKTGALDDMLENGLLVDESAPAPPKPSTAASPTAKQAAIPRIKLKVPPKYKLIAKGAGAPKKPKAGKTSTAAAGVEYDLVWQSKALTRRDLTIPKASGTHATGSVNLDKGLLPQEVDHRHYFREDVFPKLAWAKATASTEEAHAKFHLVLQGVSYGEFDLRIGHTIGTDSAGYKQNNAMTRLSWGPMREYIAHPEYMGMTLSLYRDKADPTRFMLEID